MILKIERYYNKNYYSGKDDLSKLGECMKSIRKVVSCMSRIVEANKEVTNEIITRLNPKLREELQKMMPEL